MNGNNRTHLEFDVLVLQDLHIESNGGDRLNVLVGVILQSI